MSDIVSKEQLDALMEEVAESEAGVSQADSDREFIEMVRGIHGNEKEPKQNPVESKVPEEKEVPYAPAIIPTPEDEAATIQQARNAAIDAAPQTQEPIQKIPVDMAQTETGNNAPEIPLQDDPRRLQEHKARSRTWAADFAKKGKGQKLFEEAGILPERPPTPPSRAEIQTAIARVTRTIAQRYGIDARDLDTTAPERIDEIWRKYGSDYVKAKAALGKAKEAMLWHTKDASSLRARQLGEFVEQVVLPQIHQNTNGRFSKPRRPLSRTTSHFKVPEVNAEGEKLKAPDEFVPPEPPPAPPVDITDTAEFEMRFDHPASPVDTGEFESVSVNDEITIESLSENNPNNSSREVENEFNDTQKTPVTSPPLKREDFSITPVPGLPEKNLDTIVEAYSQVAPKFVAFYESLDPRVTVVLPTEMDSDVAESIVYNQTSSGEFNSTWFKKVQKGLERFSNDVQIVIDPTAKYAIDFTPGERSIVIGPKARDIEQVLYDYSLQDIAQENLSYKYDSRFHIDLASGFVEPNSTSLSLDDPNPPIYEIATITEDLLDRYPNANQFINRIEFFDPTVGTAEECRAKNKVKHDTAHIKNDILYIPCTEPEGLIRKVKTFAHRPIDGLSEQLSRAIGGGRIVRFHPLKAEIKKVLRAKEVDLHNNKVLGLT